METWKSIQGFDFYQVSNTGKVQRLFSQSGKLYPTPHSLKPWKNRGGYLVVQLFQEGHRRRVCLHTLVLEHFGSPRPPGTECRHLDNNKMNNNSANLVWGTRLENYQDLIESGHCHLMRGGHDKPRLHKRKVTEEVERSILAEYVPYKVSKPTLAKKYGLATAMVQNILERTCHKYHPWELAPVV